MAKICGLVIMSERRLVASLRQMYSEFLQEFEGKRISVDLDYLMWDVCALVGIEPRKVNYQLGELVEAETMSVDELQEIHDRLERITSEYKLLLDEVIHDRSED